MIFTNTPVKTINRIDFPKITKIENFKNGYFNTPAITVKGSPTIGIKEKNVTRPPYFLK